VQVYNIPFGFGVTIQGIQYSWSTKSPYSKILNNFVLVYELGCSETNWKFVWRYLKVDVLDDGIGCGRYLQLRIELDILYA
jgi:hypothetical protein